MIDSKEAIKKSCFSFVNRWRNYSYIQETCDYLRNKYSLNTNILLLCCWLASIYRRLNNNNIKNLEDRVRNWRYQVLEKLKTLHCFLSARSDKVSAFVGDIADMIDKAELVELSLMQQILIYIDDIPSEKNTPTNIAFGNIFDYINYQGINLHKNDLEKIYNMVKTMF